MNPTEITNPAYPTRKHLIDLMQDGKLHPKGYLKILELRLEEGEGCEYVSKRGLYDLYRSGMLSRQQYDDLVPGETDVKPSDDLRSVTEQYEDKGVEMRKLSND